MSPSTGFSVAWINFRHTEQESFSVEMISKSVGTRIVGSRELCRGGGGLVLSVQGKRAQSPEFESLDGLATPASGQRSLTCCLPSCCHQKNVIDKSGNSWCGNEGSVEMRGA